MPSPITSATTPWYRQASKVVAAVATTGAACASIFSFLYSYGVVGKSEAHQTVGNLGVAWVGVRPVVDTATAIGDTVHLAATITDRAGAILVGTRPAWSSENPRVALVGEDGSVIAQGPGATTITVAVGGRVARSRIVVRQRVAAVEVIGGDGADGVTLRELDRQSLRARARDARGHAIADVAARWRVDDSTVVALDSAGNATARAPGRTIVTATKTGGEKNETRFAAYFVEAYETEAADRDRNGRVSVLEAFDYAKAKVVKAFEQEGSLLTEHATLDDGSEGKLAATVFLAPAGGETASKLDMTNPAIRDLVKERDALEQQIAGLKLRKSDMDPAQYEQQLEKLLLELAGKSRALQQLAGKKE